MKHFIIVAGFLSIAAISCTSNETKKTEEPVADSTTATTTSSSTTPAPALDSATMMKNWEAYSTPGDMHKLLAGWSGNWSGEVSTWHAPNTPPTMSKVSSVNKMVMGGRYQVAENKGDMMGMPFEGTSTTGYDNAQKKFISTWIDNVGTGVMKMEGQWDEASKSLTLTGKCVDPSAGTGKEMDVKQITRVIDNNNQVFEMYGPGPDGKEYKMMEIKLTRK